MDLEYGTTKVDDGSLGDDNDDPDADEHDVSAHSLEDVEFIVDLSGGKHVEDLEEYEHVEDDGEMSRVGLFGEWLVDDFTLEIFHHTVEDVWAEEINVASC